MIFLGAVLVLVLVLGSVIYLIEGPDTGFASIPVSIYRAIVTMTTVGYGDLAPQTELGRVVASLTMIIGYAIIAVPTGIVTVEMGLAHRLGRAPARTCPSCGLADHDENAAYCKRCGAVLGAPA